MGTKIEGPKVLVSVIIVSYNTRDMTLECLKTTLTELQGVSAEVLLVDNASTDGSIEAVAAAFPQVTIVANNRNAGFGAANNMAMRQAKGEYFLLVNSDAFLKPGSVEAMLQCIERNQNCAVVGPRLLNADGSLQVSCFRFPSPARAWLENLWISAIFSRHPKLGDYRRWDHDFEREVESVTGACMLVKREAYDKTGGFDERYFMYQEETDWQKTLREMGYSVFFTPTAVVTHFGGASGKDEAVKVNAHFFDSLDYYERKHHGIMGLVLVRSAMVLGCFVRTLAWAVVMLVAPGKRKTAAAKTRHHSRLLLRQATHWKSAVRGS